MVLKIGKEDAFERCYTQRFRQLCAEFGQFVQYEKDLAARDIGVHLTEKSEDGSETVTTSLCWFQLKGMQKTSRSNPSADDDAASLRLAVAHLRFWYLQPHPTYLALYLERFDRFLVLNLQAYVAENWGTRILEEERKSVTVKVPMQSILDAQAFAIIRRNGSAEAWQKLLDTDEATARIGVRDFNLIWRVSNAPSGTKHRIRYWRWLSKLRAQLWIEESEQNGWIELREHWEIGLSPSTLPQRYPYFEFYRLPLAGYDASLIDDNEPEDDADDDWSELSEDTFFVPGVGLIAGDNKMGELVEFEVGVRLNELGTQLVQHIQVLLKAGMLHLKPEQSEWISIAPWEGRSV